MADKNLLKFLLIVGLFQSSSLGSIQQILQSPCPEIFQYRYDENGVLYGTIKIHHVEGRKIQLNVELSVGNSVEGYNGNIQLADDKPKIVDDIVHNRPIIYNVFFPVWNMIPPKVTKILLNGNVICRGMRIDIGLVPVLTTINLQHILKIDVTPLSAPYDPPPDNLPEGTELNFDVRKPPPPLYGMDPSKNPNHPIFGNNQFNFNPPPPKNGMVQVHNINFNPEMPKNPEKIYPSNPFFTSITSTASPDNVNIPKKDNTQGKIPNSALFNTRTSERPTAIKPETSGRIPSITIPSGVASQSTKSVQTSYDDICGRPVRTNSLIVNGNEVSRGAYPWLVAIFAVKANGLNYICGGTLISNKHVVTAAHCVQSGNKKRKPREILCVLGKLNLQEWGPNSGGLMIDPEVIDVHPEYNPMTADADIAVLTLSEEVTFNNYVRPLCLWKGTKDLNPIIGVEGSVVGWGKNENGEVMTAIPKQINLPIVSQENCLRSNYQFQTITSNRTFCAGSRDGTGPCNGDSGSGFLIQEGGIWMLRGIVSMSIFESHRSCDLHNYIVFTDASKFTDWLLLFIK